MKKMALTLPVLLVLAFCSSPRSAFKAPGVVNGEIISVRALASGNLEKLAVSEGQSVRKGDLIAQTNLDKIANSLEGLAINEKEIANSEARTRKKIEWVKANRDYLEETVQRLQRLKKIEAASGDQLEKSRLQLQEAQTSLFDLNASLAALQIQREKIQNSRQLLELTRKDLTLTSPTDGFVLETFVSPGETVMPGTAIVDILDISRLFVEVFIEEREMALLKLGSQVDIQVDGSPERHLPGTITYFGKKAEFSPKYILSEKERQSLLFQVKITITWDPQVIKVGMPVTVTFQKT